MGEMIHTNQRILTAAQVHEIRFSGKTYVELAEIFGVDRSTIQRCINGIYYKDLPMNPAETRGKPFRRYSEAQVREIRARRKEGESIAEIARSLNAADTHIGKIARGVAYKWVRDGR